MKWKLLSHYNIFFQVNIFDLNQDDPLMFTQLAGEAVVSAWSLQSDESGELYINSYIILIVCHLQYS